MSEIRSDLQSAGDRWAAVLRRLYPAHAAKRIASDWPVEPRTAQAWLGGQSPQLRHLLRAAEIHGDWLVAEVCAAGSRWHAELELLRRLDETERQLQQIRDALTGAR